MLSGHKKLGMHDNVWFPIIGGRGQRRFQSLEHAVRSVRWTAAFLAVFAGLCFCPSNLLADTHYVSLSGGNTLPYTNWATAATNIQSAIDVAISGDIVLVTNGIYAEGGRVSNGCLVTNRIMIDKQVTVRSVNGPTVTIIKGTGPPDNNSAVRCAYVGTNAILSGFGLTNGNTRNSGNFWKDISGGGAYCEVSALVTNSIITGNSAATYGGGVAGGKLSNCTLSHNVARDGGGGAFDAILNNCIISCNSAGLGGGVYGGTIRNSALSGNSAFYFGGGAVMGTLANCTLSYNSAGQEGGGSSYSILNNCIVYYNTALFNPNYDGTNLTYCCTTPSPGGLGNITCEPLMASLSHLSATSPCIGSGTYAFVSGADIDGETWQSHPSIGCDEICAGAVTGSLAVSISVSYTNVAIGFPLTFTAYIMGRTTASIWDFSDGTSQVSNQPCVAHVFAATGTYAVVLRAFNESNPNGVQAIMTVCIQPSVIHYVALSNATPSAAFRSWTTAATDIQSAIDVALPGDQVVVSNGVYSEGGRVAYGFLTNRVVLDKPIWVQSVNGPTVTTIRGEPKPGDNAVRPLYMGANSVLSGFTLTGGNVKTNGYYIKETDGGGAWCDPSAVMSNCIVLSNSAYGSGGGVAFGTMYACTVKVNSAMHGGGVYYSRLFNCTITDNSAGISGGGTEDATVIDSTVTENSALSGSGGADYSVLYSCVLSGNTAPYGGGSGNGTLYNCTVAGNSSSNNCGGSSGDVLFNCIVYSNASPTNANYSGSIFSYSCTTPMPTSGVGNITSNPQFADLISSDFRLRSTSPCIDSGQNQEWMTNATDIAGLPRVLNSHVDMGAYEFRYESSLRGLLAGAWGMTNGAMRAGNPSTNSPYKAAAIMVTNVPTNAVDWVLVSVRESPTGTPVASVSAILLSDGRIVGADGSSNVNIEAKGNLYGVLQHRNHLAVMSANPIFTNRIVQFDFSADPNLLRGGTNAVVQVSTNRWGMIPGNADGDGRIGPVDDLIRKSQGP